MHENRFYRTGEYGPNESYRKNLKGSPCSVEGCVRRAGESKGLCSMHYKRIKDKGEAGSPLPLIGKKYLDKCRVKGCEKLANAGLGYCSMHYSRNYRKGSVGDVNSSMAKKGEGYINADGYRVKTTDIYCDKKKRNLQVLEHRLIMSQKLGRDLLPNENVHHINGDRLDNRPENLELWVTKQPPGKRVPDLIQYAKEILSQYEPNSLNKNNNLHLTDLCFLA